MSWIKDSIKVLGINLGVTLFLLGLLIIIPALWGDVQSAFKEYVEKPVQKKSSRANLSHYENEPWGAMHFFEFEKLATRYYDFIGWRRMPFQGKTITIDQDGFRRHRSKAKSPEDAEIWVFGGSTVWGTGSPDNKTIPAQLEKLTGKSTFNFGESGYVSHQSLNLLMRQYLAGGHPKLVIFYDGVNEVTVKCRTELNFYSTAEEQEIREKVDKKGSRFLSLFQPIVRIIVKNTTKKSQGYDCHTNDKKSELIAKNLAQDWATAKNLVESNGGTFIGIIQPVAYIGTPRIDYLPENYLDPLIKRQYETVYPKIKKALDSQKITYYELTDIFDGSDEFYIDFCHVTPAGNEKIARFISDIK